MAYSIPVEDILPEGAVILAAEHSPFLSPLGHFPIPCLRPPIPPHFFLRSLEPGFCSATPSLTTAPPLAHLLSPASPQPGTGSVAIMFAS